MTERSAPPGDDAAAVRIAALERRIAKLEKINAVLIDRIERGGDPQSSAYSLFQTTIALDRQVRMRTDEVTRTLRRLEQTNDALTEARDRAERADRAKTRFLAQSGHDLLQPLAAARLTVSALTEIETGGDGRRLVRQVDRSLATIEGLLRALLDISKLDAGAVTPQTAIVALDDLLADLAADFAPIARRRGLTLRLRSRPVHVATDPMMLTRVLQNLIGNALRYTERGTVLVAVRPRPETVRIDVIDTGPGIAPDQREMVFEEFHRGRRQPADGEIGLGLGLAIVQRLVDALGVAIRLRSRLDHGTTFTIELARAEPPPAPAATDERATQGWGLEGAVVLVVDDDAGVRTATVELIERWRCVAIAAESVETAAAATAAANAAGRGPDLIVADYHLAEATALEAIAAVRAAAGRPVPAIVVTADRGRDTEERVAKAGFELLAKPVRPAELRSLMAHLLG